MNLAKSLAIFAILTIGSGCCSTPVDATIGLPDRPDLIPVTQELWEQLPLEAQDLWVLNDLALKEHIKKLEARINLHDEGR